jgi:predicted nucleotidyltransferase
MIANDRPRLVRFRSMKRSPGMKPAHISPFRRVKYRKLSTAHETWHRPTVQPFEGAPDKAWFEWPAIVKAIADTESKLRELEYLLLPSDGRPLAENVSLVLCGSLARGESTSQSDLDWILLINGEVDGQHFRIFQSIREKLRAEDKILPGKTGTFDSLVFSHELVHCIGGQDDTNKNLTLRMLLLLELVSIGDDEPRQMVIRAILKRYLADDPSWTWEPDRKLPRFLLNDVIRFWRTMAVDFADKYRDQQGEKWALRNAKLRFSRKLVLLTGMLACFSWRLRGLKSSNSDKDRTVEMAITYFEEYLSRPPLEILADELMRTEASPDVSRKVFSAYDRFLAILDDPEARVELETIPRESAAKSPEFKKVRELSHEFRDALLEWLYIPESALYELVRQYALF